MKKRKDGRYLKVVTINGKRLYFYSSKTTEQQAERDINRQILAYTQQEERGKLFSEVAEEWEEEHFPKIEYNTARRYKVLLNYAIEEFEDIYIKDIQPIDVEQYLNYFVSRNYSSKSIKDTLSVLRLVCKYACIKDYITTDPTRYITPPKGKASVKRQALTEEEVEIVKDNINQPFGLFPYFLMYTGLRKGEALALQYKDIDFDNKYLTITASKEEDVNDEGKNYIRRERNFGSYKRQFYLGDINEDEIKAEFNNGILKVVVPKKEIIDTKKKIEIG